MYCTNKITNHTGIHTHTHRAVYFEANTKLTACDGKIM
jgi:hypothetical protein